MLGESAHMGIALSAGTSMFFSHCEAARGGPPYVRPYVYLYVSIFTADNLAHKREKYHFIITADVSCVLIEGNLS